MKNNKIVLIFTRIKKTVVGKGLRLALGLGLLANPGWAGERHFSYNYETDVLGSDMKELETYTTYRFGRDHFFSGLNERLEFEIGLGGGVQTSLYLNFDQELEADKTGNVTNSPIFDGISNEWLFRLADGETGPLGVALYLEPEFKPDELELETKVIIDKSMGGWKWTFNFTVEPEYHLMDNTSAVSIIPSLGAGYFLIAHFLIGVEALDLNFYPGDNRALSESVFSLGPVFSYTGGDWWATLTILPQITDLKKGGLNLADSQRWQIRLATSLAIQ